MTGISGLGFDSVFDALEQPTETKATNTSKVVQQLRCDCMFENLHTKTFLVDGTKSVAGGSWTRES